MLFEESSPFEEYRLTAIAQTNPLSVDAADGKQARAEMAAELRDLLSAPSPAGVDGLEVATFLHTMHMELGQTEQFCSKWQGDPFGVSGVDYSSTYSVTSEPLCRLSDAQAEVHSSFALTLRKLGDASYAIYLLHMPILIIIWHALPVVFDIRYFFKNLEIGAAVILVLTIALSLAYYKYVEQVLLKVKFRARTQVQAHS